MVYYTNVLEAIFDAFEKFRQIDRKLRALTFFPREFWGALKMHTFSLGMKVNARNFPSI